MPKVYINKDWFMLERPMCDDRYSYDLVVSSKDDWYECDIPCDVSMPLIKAGKINDPAIADYCYDNEWIEDRSWWFKKIIDTKDLIGFEQASCIDLVFSSLDHTSDIFLNDTWIGNHKSSHYEFRKDVKRLLTKGQNVIMVRLTSGLETVSQEDLLEVDCAICTEEPRRKDRGDKRRAFLRKPQYVYGWDWSPRAVTIGIADDVYFEISKNIRINDVNIFTKSINNDKAIIQGEIEIENLNILSTFDAEYISLTMLFNQQVEASWSVKDVFLCSGLNYIPFELTLDDAHLWWPNGMGEQHLYTIKTEVRCGDVVDKYPEFNFGIRTIQLDTSRIKKDRRDFKFLINSQDMFAKGANWIPSDLIYMRVDDKRMEQIISEAANANMNILRIWGGAIYNRDVFYNLCDRYGIMVWQDFMFACSAYPDSIESFVDLCEKEMEYQTRRLRNHACMALFCGNNECHEIFSIENFMGWEIKADHAKQYGLMLSNVTAKKIVHRNCPHIPYWNSSPYGGELPQSQNVGDVHYWNDAMMSPIMENRISVEVYDKVSAAFVSEYGYIGPPCMETIKQYHGNEVVEKKSYIWDIHNNTMEKDTVDAGIQKHYTKKELTLEEYILYAQMVQSTILNYSLEAFRFSLLCNGGIFWMFNDCWGEVGWTVLDYYLRRKASYYGVKRAFEPVKIMIRAIDGVILVVGANDTDKDIVFEAEVGWITFDGTTRETTLKSFVLEKRSRKVIYKEKIQKKDISQWIYVVIPKDDKISHAVLNQKDACKKRTTSKVSVIKYVNICEDLHISLRAEGYVHGVYFDQDYRYSDNYFDMLPGEEKTVVVYMAANKRPIPKTVPLEQDTLLV